MYILETYANNAKEALERSAKYLNTQKDDIEIDLLTKGKSKFLGLGTETLSLFGIKTIESTPVEVVVRGIISTILGKTGCEFKIQDIEHIKEQKKIAVRISSKKNDRYIIGNKGKNLDSIQYIVNILLERFSSKSPKVILDVDGYREQRKEYLVDLSNRVLKKVMESKKDYTLKPLNAYERHIIHSTLQDVENVDTHTLSSHSSIKRVKIIYTGEDKHSDKKANGYTENKEYSILNSNANAAPKKNVNPKKMDKKSTNSDVPEDFKKIDKEQESFAKNLTEEK